MSQEKVDKYKQEKQNRKNPKKVSKFKRIFIKRVIPYGICAIIVVALLFYFGRSVAIQTNMYTPPTEERSWSDGEIESLRQVLIQATDPNVQYTTQAQPQQAYTVNPQDVPTKKTSVKTTKKK